MRVVFAGSAGGAAAAAIGPLAAGSAILLALLDVGCARDRPIAPRGVDPPPCATTAEVLVTGEPFPISLRLDESQLYFALAQDLDAGERAHRVRRAPRDGGPGGPLVEVANAQAIAAFGGYLYWAQWGPGGGIRRIAASGGAPEVLLTADLHTARLVVDQSGIYYGERRRKLGYDRIYRLPHGGGAAILLAEDSFVWRYADTSDDPLELAVDETDVYWIQRPTVPEGGGENRDGRLWRVPKAGGPQVELARELAAPSEPQPVGDTIWIWESADPFAEAATLRGVRRDGAAGPRLEFPRRPRAAVVSPERVYFVPPQEPRWYARRLDGRGPVEALADSSIVFATAAAPLLDRRCGLLYFVDSRRAGTVLRLPLTLRAGGPDAAASPPDAALADGGLGAGCLAQGGICVPGKWANCPPGSQPTADVHADCMPKTASRGYFCCVPAPPSSCVNEARSDCFVGQCHACWGPTGPGLSCAGGRVCCQYVCLD